MYMSFNHAKPLMHTFYTGHLCLLCGNVTYFYGTYYPIGHLITGFRIRAFINFIEAGFREPAVRDQ